MYAPLPVNVGFMPCARWQRTSRLAAEGPSFFLLLLGPLGQELGRSCPTAKGCE